MQTRLIVIAIAVAVAGLAGFVGFRMGSTAGMQESLLVGARINLLLEIKIGEVARQHGLNDALSRLDAHINSLVIEVEQLTEAASARDQQSTSRALEAVAAYRNAFQDASAADNNPSSDHVKAILSRYGRPVTQPIVETPAEELRLLQGL